MPARRSFVPPAAAASHRQSEPADQRVKVLLVTGVEYHNWRETAPQIAKQLASCPEIEVRLETNINVLCSDEIFDYDVLFFNFWNSRDDRPTQDDDLALSNIEKFLDSGKGIVVYHLAIGIFETRKERVEQIIGRVYDRCAARARSVPGIRSRRGQTRSSDHESGLGLQDPG